MKRNLKIVIIFLLCCISLPQNIGNCSIFKNSTTERIKNGDFSTTACAVTSATTTKNCYYNITNCTSSCVTGWNPNDMLQIGIGSFYSNLLTNTQKILELTAISNTCVNQTITNLSIGKYYLVFYWLARQNTNLIYSKISISVNGIIVKNLSSTDYLIKKESIQINVSTAGSNCSLKFCGTGTGALNNGSLLVNASMFQYQCTNCVEGYGPFNTLSCRLCNQTCKCDGWVQPKVNNKCSTKCGDGYLRENQQCEDGNQNIGDGCYQCKKQQILADQSYTHFAALIFFGFGFTLEGLQILNIFQNFQLLLKSFNIYTFQISNNIHGYTNSEEFFIKALNSNHILFNFNFMLFSLALVFIFMIFFMILNSCQYQKVIKIKKKKLKNSQITKEQQNTKYGNQQIDNQSIINQSQNSANNLKNKQNQQKQKLDTKQDIKPKKQLSNIINILKRSFIYLYANCSSIFFFSLLKQLKQQSIDSFKNGQTILPLIFMLIMLLVFFKISLNQNLQLKQIGQNFQKDKWKFYWRMILIQKIVFSILVNNQYLWSLLLMIAIKFIVMIIYLINKIFSNKLQRTRNLFVQFLHIVILCLFTFNEYKIKTSTLKQKMTQINVNILQIVILMLLLLVYAIFLLKSLFTNKSDQNQESKNINNEENEENEYNNKSDEKSNDQMITKNQDQRITKKKVKQKQQHLQKKKKKEENNIQKNINKQQDGNNQMIKVKKIKNFMKSRK